MFVIYVLIPIIFMAYSWPRGERVGGRSTRQRVAVNFLFGTVYFIYTRLRPPPIIYFFSFEHHIINVKNIRLTKSTSPPPLTLNKQNSIQSRLPTFWRGLYLHEDTAVGLFENKKNLYIYMYTRGPLMTHYRLWA